MTSADEVSIVIASSAKEFSGASVWLAAECRQRRIDESQSHRLDLCLTEALANVLAHGGRDGQMIPIEIGLRFESADATNLRGMALTVSAGGLPFDPTTHVPRPRPATLDDAEPGGLGITMMRANADEIRYRREGGRNQTTFVVRWNDTPA